MPTLRVTLLGCGSSGGVPRATGDWGACDPNEPKNRRTRCGLLLQQWQGDVGDPRQATTVLIDTPPEVRQQLADAGARRLDGVFISHDHADQTNGFDDVRAFFLQDHATIPVWMDVATRETFMQRFGYAFASGPGYPAIARCAGEIAPLTPIAVPGPGGAMSVLPLDQDHGFSRSLGFRIGPVAYSNDLVAMPEETFAELDGLSLWIVDALRERPHPTHAHLAKTLGWIARVKPRHALLTNMHQDLDYATLKARLPVGVEPGYDGWVDDFRV